MRISTHLTNNFFSLPPFFSAHPVMFFPRLKMLRFEKERKRESSGSPKVRRIPRKDDRRRISTGTMLQALAQGMSKNSENSENSENERLMKELKKKDKEIARLQRELAKWNLRQRSPPTITERTEEEGQE